VWILISFLKSWAVAGIYSFFKQAGFPTQSSSPELRTFESCLADKPDLIFAHRLNAMAPVLLTERALPPVIMDLDDVEHVKYMRQLNQPPSRLRTKFYYLHVPALLWGEQSSMRKAAKTFVCSTRDQQYLNKYWKQDKVSVIYNSTVIPRKNSLVKDPILLLVGGYYYHPNITAANFLINEIWPHIHRVRPDAKLMIVGPRPENIDSFTNPPDGVVFTGHVQDLDAVYRQARIVCCPILTGGGTRVKLVEGAAYGKGIVSTRIGAEGLDMSDGNECFLRDEAWTFAKSCIELLRSDDLCRDMGDAARKYAETYYDEAKVMDQIRMQIEEVLPKPLKEVTLVSR
jgi:glycosyltransferase involved in cell wall biosynthesis